MWRMPLRWLALAVLVTVATAFAARGADVERWDCFELTLPGPAGGNPFVDVFLEARFTGGERTISVVGFYDGDGSYCVRFMPDATGVWQYETKSNIAELNGKTGQFTCTKPSPANHGPVRVANTYHFAHADGTPYVPLGTTCYAWIHQT